MPTPPTPAHLGTAIRQIRESRKLSIETLASKAGISWRYLSDIERGKDEQGNPSWIVLGKLAAALGEEVSVLAQRAEKIRSSPAKKN